MKQIFIILISGLSIGCSQGPLGLSEQGQSELLSSGTDSLFGAGNAYAAEATTILQQNCTSCHGANSGPGGVYDLTDGNYLLSSGLIVAGQPDQSPLFTAVNNGIMPPTGALSSANKDTLRNWILAAAPAN